jgi:hypothetical protein
MEREIVHVDRIDAAPLARAVQAVYRGELEHARLRAERREIIGGESAKRTTCRARGPRA